MFETSSLLFIAPSDTLSTLTNLEPFLNIITSVVSVCREVGARPSHRSWRDRRWNPAEPGNTSRTFLEVSYDCAPSNLHQVQPVPLSQCTAWGLRTQKHTAYAHSGNVQAPVVAGCSPRWACLPRIHIHSLFFFSYNFGLFSSKGAGAS